MDKILITSFRNEIATAILNSQQKLNPDGDAYISESELPAVLEFFGETDVNKLLKSNNNTDNSIFTDNAAGNEGQRINTEEYTELMSPDNAVLRDDGTAAYELQNNISSDLLTSSVGTPFEAQMKNLYEQRRALAKKHESTDVVDAKIEALTDAVQEYIKLHQQDVTQHLADNNLVKQFKYGKNGEKTGYYIQTFSVKANNSYNNDNNDSEPENSDNTETNNNATVGGISYNIEVVTDNLHAIGHIDADSENSDISAVAVYNRNFNNNSRLNVSGNFRQTIEPDNNQTSLGASLDFSQNRFSTGAFGAYESSETEGISNKSTIVEAYARYGTSLRGAIGFANESEKGMSYSERYVKAKVSGVRAVNNNLTLTGSLEGTYGIANLNMNENNDRFTTMNLNAKGGLSFKSSHSDFSANVLANVSIDNQNPTGYGNMTTVSSTLLGNISTDKVDITTTLSNMNAPDFYYDDDAQEVFKRKNTWSSSITVGLKKIFGKNVVPSFTYNVSNDDLSKQNIAVNLGINF